MLSEKQIFRIDHYLGKPSVQNLFALRFGNALFEPLWRRENIANIQITIAEDLGVEKRGAFYDQHRRAARHGAEPCAAAAVRAGDGAADQRPCRRDPRREAQGAALAQALDARDAGPARRSAASTPRATSAASRCRGYREEPGVDPRSNTETFVALRAEIANWRWAGVPFYIRTGKRLAARDARIVVNFRPAPHAIFQHARWARPTAW